MTPSLPRLLCACAALAAFACAPRAAVPSNPTAHNGDANAEYAAFTRAFLDAYYAAHPVRSTGLGLHQHDDRLPDLSAAAVQARTAALKRSLEQLQRIDRARLTGDAVFDIRIVDHAIRAELLELEDTRDWQRQPMLYNSTVANGLSSLAEREFAPVADRMQSLMARMRQIPAVFAAARANLRDVPRLWVEQTMRDTRGTVTFLREDLPQALEAQGVAQVPPDLRARFDAERATAITEVEAFLRWQEQELLPRANGDFRLGRALFERKLALEEHVAFTADDLRDLNDRAIRDYHAWVAREAARIDPAKSPREVMDQITRDVPTPEQLLPLARTQLEQCQRFVLEKDLLTLPSRALPTVRETPPYARIGFASMDTPGPFETRATEAFYNLTNVEPDWTPQQKAQHLTYFNRSGLLGITVHEGMPGHFVQLLYQSQIPTEVRKVFAPSSLVEGWAHYAEQLMVDEGLGGGAPDIRLGQLRRALQRHARWHAGVAMHAYGASVEDAAGRYAEISFFEAFPALREVQRGTFDATYLYYALGRMQILQLREDYRAHLEARGETFSLKDFHDRFLRLGLPISLAREALMPQATAADARP